MSIRKFTCVVWPTRLAYLFIYMYVTRVQSICKSYLDISTLYSDLKVLRSATFKTFLQYQRELNAKLNINQ